MITELGMKKASAAIYAIVDGIRVIFDDGKVQTLPIYDGEAKENQIKIMGLLSDDVVGRIQQIDLMDKDGDVFASRQYYFDKKEIEGLLVSFIIGITENEVL